MQPELGTQRVPLDELKLSPLFLQDFAAAKNMLFYLGLGYKCYHMQHIYPG